MNADKQDKTENLRVKNNKEQTTEYGKQDKINPPQAELEEIEKEKIKRKT
ncbi:MAG: hypothetical protein PHX21_06955 [bacterium]|nr:hypothetical protein [bacterium]